MEHLTINNQGIEISMLSYYDIYRRRRERKGVIILANTYTEVASLDSVLLILVFVVRSVKAAKSRGNRSKPLSRIRTITTTINLSFVALRTAELERLIIRVLNAY
jgi:hypothetical protein